MASILVVDDNPANLKLLAFLLTSHGHSVRTASDGARALAAVATEKPALILMDLQLPGADGLTITRQLKADPATRGIPIIAVTAFAMKGDDERALAAGCDAYVTKPIDTRGLPVLVQELLERAGAPGT
ncbi:MAG: response regulator [Deltaproteobacteria bacterium]|nr:response regulator [Deltaproteobacteria bacterium]